VLVGRLSEEVEENLPSAVDNPKKWGALPKITHLILREHARSDRRGTGARMKKILEAAIEDVKKLR
jgi:hypothetical protein